jgi:hypothetical protein
LSILFPPLNVGCFTKQNAHLTFRKIPAFSSAPILKVMLQSRIPMGVSPFKISTLFFHCQVSRGKTVKIKSGRSLHHVMPKEHGVPEISDLLLKHYLTLHSSLFPTPCVCVCVCVCVYVFIKILLFGLTIHWWKNILISRNQLWQ